MGELYGEEDKPIRNEYRIGYPINRDKLHKERPICMLSGRGSISNPTEQSSTRTHGEIRWMFLRSFPLSDRSQYLLYII